MPKRDPLANDELFGSYLEPIVMMFKRVRSIFENERFAYYAIPLVHITFRSPIDLVDNDGVGTRTRRVTSCAVICSPNGIDERLNGWANFPIICGARLAEIDPVDPADNDDVEPPSVDEWDIAVEWNDLCVREDNILSVTTDLDRAAEVVFDKQVGETVSVSLGRGTLPYDPHDETYARHTIERYEADIAKWVAPTAEA